MGRGKDKERASEKFFNQIYSDHYDSIYFRVKNILYSKIADDISSCTQETFTRAWMNIESLQNHQNIAGWLVVTAKNIAQNFNSRYLTNIKNSNYSATDAETIAEENFTEKIDSELVAEKILSQLSASERKLYELKHVMGLSNEDIGKIFEISPNAVASRNKRLKDKLAELVFLKK